VFIKSSTGFKFILEPKINGSPYNRDKITAEYTSILILFRKESKTSVASRKEKILIWKYLK